MHDVFKPTAHDFRKRYFAFPYDPLCFLVEIVGNLDLGLDHDGNSPAFDLMSRGGHFRGSWVMVRISYYVPLSPRAMRSCCAPMVSGSWFWRMKWNDA